MQRAAFAIKVNVARCVGGGGPRIYNGNTDNLIYTRQTFSRYTNCEVFRYTPGCVLDGQLFFTFYWFSFANIFY